MKKIIVCDNMHNEVFNILNKADGIEVIDATSNTKEELASMLENADVAITRSPTPVNEAFLKNAKNIKAVVRAGVGVDNVDIDASSKQGVIIMNVPTANTIAAVELTMTHILSAARELPAINQQLKYENIWDRKSWYGVELKGKKLGVIGFGHIGSRVATRAKAFEMDIVAFDPYIAPSKVTSLDMTYTTNFDDILDCDFITIHTPKTKETINMITKDEIAKMKDGVRVINVARGGLLNENDLYDGLKSGKIKFAGIDVFNEEPCPNHKLFELPNVNVSPHLGANTLESQKRIAQQAADAAIQAAKGINYPNALNLPIKEDEIPEMVKPFIELTQKLGFLAAQTNKGMVKKIELCVDGEISKYANSLITFALVGALKESLGENINYVNAKFLAKDKDIEVKINTKEVSSSYKNLVSIKLATPQKSVTISGTIYDEEIQRIVKIDNFVLDVEPKGKMIIFKNKDIPGVVAKVSTILANNNINIADFRLGRGKDDALAVVVVDDNISKEIMNEVESLDFCIWASYVSI
jgi:D-3-phosphoglycerate dehydrogenase